jgi:V8-like Glu-specific endopeptidase
MSTTTFAESPTSTSTGAPPTGGATPSPRAEAGDVVESSDFSTETTTVTEAGGLAPLPSDAHNAVSTNLGLTPSTGPGGGGVASEAGTAGTQETAYEEATGWNEQAASESGQLGADEATAVDAGTVEADQQEFFQFLIPLIKPLVGTVLPAAAKALAGGGLPPQLLQALGGLFGQPQRRPAARREAAGYGNGSGGVEAVGFDEAAVAEYIQQLEVVIGTDDRVQITNTRAVPWRRIVQLTITAGNGRKFLGSGALVGPRTIITAAHCVYMHSQGGFVREIQCSPGRNGDQKPYGTMNGSRVWTVRGWTVHKNPDCDYAAIILPRPVSQQDPGWFGFANLNDIELMSSRLNMSGYPGDKPLGTQWFHGRVAKSVSDRRIFYDIDSMGGQSGSPVWLRRPDGKRYMVGIHTTGSPTGNSAVRINQQVFQNLRNWRTNPDG